MRRSWSFLAAVLVALTMALPATAQEDKAPQTKLLTKCPKTMEYPEEITFHVRTKPEGLDYRFFAYYIPEPGVEVLSTFWDPWPATEEPLSLSFTPGRYRVEVAAVSPTGEVDPTPDTCTFTVLP